MLTTQESARDDSVRCTIAAAKSAASAVSWTDFEAELVGYVTVPVCNVPSESFSEVPSTHSWQICGILRVPVTILFPAGLHSGQVHPTLDFLRGPPYGR